MTVTFSMDRTEALSCSTTVSNVFIAEYARSAPQGFTAVYLYALMQSQNGAFANDDIASALDMTEEQICAAFEYWQKKGLLTVVRSDPLHIEIGRARSSQVQGHERFSGLLEKLRPVLGTRVLTPTELKVVFDWIDVFGLEEDAVIALFIYCLEIKGARTSIRYMDEIAKGWADMNIRTAADAEAYIKETTEYHLGAKEILKLFGLKRNPTEAEVTLYKKWRCEYHMSKEVIKEACSYTAGSSNPSFAYLDKIIEALHEEGALDIEEVRQRQKERLAFEDFCKEVFLRAGLVKKPDAAQKERIEMWLSSYHLPKDVIILMAEHARSKPKPFAFMCKAAQDLHDRDILNLHDAAEYLSETAQSAVSSPAGSYAKHNYTAEDLAKIGVNLDDDDE